VSKPRRRRKKEGKEGSRGYFPRKGISYIKKKGGGAKSFAHGGRTKGKRGLFHKGEGKQRKGRVDSKKGLTRSLLFWGVKLGRRGETYF